MEIVFLVTAAYIADKYKKPFHLTAAYVVFIIYREISRNETEDLLLRATVITVFCLAYFLTLIKFSGNLAIWLFVLIGFPFGFFLLPITL
jgi:hypothetical protein